MKKISFLMLCFLLIAGSASSQSVDNRQSLLEFYEKTRNDLFNEVKGLSAEQMQFKPSAEKWSVAQCLEHIVVSEQMLFGMARDSLQKPATPERRDEVKMTSDQIIAGILDRSFQAKAPEGMQPTGKYTDPAKGMKEFDGQRKAMRKFLEEVDIEGLKDHVADSPFGPINAYHTFMFIAGHTGRHTLHRGGESPSGIPR